MAGKTMTGQQLRRLRRKHGVTQRHLGAIASMFQTNIAHLERGHWPITAKMAARLIVAFKQIVEWRRELSALIRAKHPGEMTKAGVIARVREIELAIIKQPVFHHLLRGDPAELPAWVLEGFLKTPVLSDEKSFGTLAPTGDF